MNKSNVPGKQTTRRILLAVCAAALAVTLVVGLAQPARADRNISVPDVPDNIKVPEGNKVFLVGHAIGTQNYICLPSGTGFAYALFTPQATLSDDNHEQLITHFFSVNPDKDDKGAIRATWEDSRDTSMIWAKVFVNPDGTTASSTDAKFVEKGAVAWLNLQAVGHQAGPSNGDRLTTVTFVQRLNTSGGSAPSTGCASLADVGTKAFVPYTADYFFYK
jgi:hypothetical protein